MTGRKHSTDERKKFRRKKYKIRELNHSKGLQLDRDLGVLCDCSLDRAPVQGRLVSIIKTSQQAGPLTSAPVVYDEVNMNTDI